MDHSYNPQDAILSPSHKWVHIKEFSWDNIAINCSDCSFSTAKAQDLPGAAAGLLSYAYSGSRRKRKKKRSMLKNAALPVIAAALIALAAFFFFGGGSSTPPGAVTPESEQPVEPAVPVQEEPEVVNDPPAELPEEEIAEVQEPPQQDSYSDPAYKTISDGNYLYALVTKETALRKDFAPADLQQIPAYMLPPRELWLREEALNHLVDLWQAAEEDGVILHILSTYRSYEYQEALFQNYADRHGEEEANRFSARPGQSEHQLGTAVDFGSGTGADFSAAFAETPQGEWLADNAHNYGFAMSYPEGKEYITGYIYEPWHFRYIGIEAALEWHTSALTLKEYLKTKPQYFED